MTPNFTGVKMEKLTAVVTGGTRGIGLGIGEALLKRGASLAITYLNNDEEADKAVLRLQEQAGPGCKVLLLKGDCGDGDTVRAHYQEVCEQLGPPNVLVNNAGIMFQRSLEQTSFEDWDRTIRVNLSGSFYWLSLAVGAMKKQGFGRVVNISSIAARGGGVVGPHYAASKAGQLGMTR
jgi:3-oxoacyl-[acyl-carrier protein] reductase